MAASNKTPNYELPLFTQGDPTSWMADFNPAMTKIDTAIKQAADAADQAATTANGANTTAQAAQTQAQQAASGVSALQGTVAGQSQQIQALEDKVDNLTTEKDLVIGRIIRGGVIRLNGTTLVGQASQRGRVIMLGNTPIIMAMNTTVTFSSALTPFGYYVQSDRPTFPVFYMAGNPFNLPAYTRAANNQLSNVYPLASNWDTSGRASQIILSCFYDSTSNVTIVIGRFTPSDTQLPVTAQTGAWSCDWDLDGKESGHYAPPYTPNFSTLPALYNVPIYPQ